MKELNEVGRLIPAFEAAKGIVSASENNENFMLLASITLLLMSCCMGSFFFWKWSACRDAWTDYLAKKEDKYFEIFRDKLR